MATLTKFHDLQKPEKGTTEWFVRGDGKLITYYLLNYSQHLADLVDYNVDDFLFKTETEAHEHAAAYYKHHGKDYPYHTEWQNACCVADAKNFVHDNLSQPMEFE